MQWNRPTPHRDASIPQQRAASNDPAPSEQRSSSEPLHFLTENAEKNTQLYRASDQGGMELLAAFLPDGRVRIADSGAHRYAGMIENGRADLLDVANNEWSELFLTVNPSGQTQFELRGGPYDAHVFTMLRMTDAPK
jgi:hypothetical protein